VDVSVPADVGTDNGMDSETLIAGSGLIALSAAVLTGALWDTPISRAALGFLREERRQSMPRHRAQAAGSR
jgi:hypothetical protein